MLGEEEPKAKDRSGFTPDVKIYGKKLTTDDVNRDVEEFKRILRP